jgi:DNA-binding NarL/FixJ family response regulator
VLIALDEQRVLSEDAEAAAERLELLAAELEAMSSPDEYADLSGQRLRILLVERHAQLARAFGHVLARRYELVGVVSRAGEAIERLSTHSVDVIIVGEQLGGEMTGPQLLKYVATRWPSVRRVLHVDAEQSREPAIADAVLRRPASPADVIAAVERLM